MKITEARQKVVEKLQSKGLVEKIDESYKHAVKTCYKCNSLIEPQVKEQWFLKMKPLAQPAIKAIEKGQIKFIPSHYKKIILHWLKNILDWPLSRQIVWGIPIPQDQDTFDTWFSSGQWPFATLKAGKKDSSSVKATADRDFKTFYPTDVMETAGEIIFFWVARMIMLSLYTTKKVPFKHVYLHGLVLDAKGQKMSKSRGNVINPLDITDKYGTDALRIGLVMGNTPGQSLALDENKIKGYRNFANKIWNASKFVLTNTSDYKPSRKPILSAKHKKYLKELKNTTKAVTKLMDDFKFYYAAEKTYHYFWHVFCDKIIEESKSALSSNAELTRLPAGRQGNSRGTTQNTKEKQATQYMLIEILTTSLKLLHPFMPFITEEIYQQLPIKSKKKCLMVEEWPT